MAIFMYVREPSIPVVAEEAECVVQNSDCFNFVFSNGIFQFLTFVFVLSALADKY